MTTPAAATTVLDEIDARQNDLLDELERLNARIEQVLKACLVVGPNVPPMLKAA